MGGNKGPSNAGCTDGAAATEGAGGPDTVSSSAADADIGSRLTVPLFETPMPRLLLLFAVSGSCGGGGGTIPCCVCSPAE